MNGKLLDTNVIIQYIKGNHSLEDVFEEDDLFVSSVSIGELLYGAELSAKKEQNSAVYQDFCAELTEVSIDSAVASSYAKIKAQLKRDGHPIPENDIWIAACAMCHGLTVVTADRHFSYISNLLIEMREPFQ